MRIYANPVRQFLATWVECMAATGGSALVLALLWSLAAVATAPPAQAQGGTLASHRAVYDLKLTSTRGKTSMQAARGRILYDFTGSACEGYALQFRQVSELDSGEGKVIVSDLRATSWEDGAAKRLRFHSKNYFNDSLRDEIDGQAEREPGGIAVKLMNPAQKQVNLKADLVFPTEQVRRILVAAAQGKTLLELVVYDGSDNGEKLYDTLTVIGRAIAPGEATPSDALAGQVAFAGLKRWPVTISYFDRSAGAKSGEQTPVYAITFELYENGVSRALLLDYGNFVLSGEMTSIEMKDAKPCP